ncbi:MAG TPA: hypothetical protein VGB77_04825 [Abditibacteriaceae bacterium]|jgi:hypothetical protein
MSQFDIAVPGNKTNYQPGDWLQGKATWQLDNNADWLEVRLLWFTQGKGDSDVSVEETVRVEAPSLSDSQPFRFQLPPAPYSFSGKLISLIWAIEIVTHNVKEAARFEFTLSPDGREIELGTVTAHLSDQEKALQTKAESWAGRLVQKQSEQNSPTSSSSSSGPWSDIK